MRKLFFKKIRTLRSRFALINQSRIHQKLQKKLLHANKLNIGCGRDLLKGWMNIGLSKDLEIPYGEVSSKDGKQLLHYDMTKAMPFKEESIQYIYAGHFIEHLGFMQGRVFLANCFKIMKQGGVMRVTFPDLELWIKNYYENNIDFFEKYKTFFLKGEVSAAKTKGEIFMSQVHGWGHQWNYDFESIKHILEEAGFSNIEKKSLFESSIPEIKEIEPDREYRVFETCYVEAVKD